MAYCEAVYGIKVFINETVQSISDGHYSCAPGPVNLNGKIPNIKESQNDKQILIVSNGNVKACSRKNVRCYSKNRFSSEKNFIG